MTVFDMIGDAAGRYGVPAEIASAVAWRESRYNQGARGASGEVGMFQLMPTTAADLGVNPYDLRQNIEGGVRYLAQQFERFGDWFTALTAYNAGPGRVSRGETPQASRNYAADVLQRAGASVPPTVPASLPTTAPGGIWTLPDLLPPLVADDDGVVLITLLLAGAAIVAAIASRSR
jgi:soluble lytic murein transglycosylase-like protein